MVHGLSWNSGYFLLIPLLDKFRGILLFILVYVYFPSAPPTPPTRSTDIVDAMGLGIYHSYSLVLTTQGTVVTWDSVWQGVKNCLLNLHFMVVLNNFIFSSSQMWSISGAIQVGLYVLWATLLGYLLIPPFDQSSVGYIGSSGA